MILNVIYDLQLARLNIRILTQQNIKLGPLDLARKLTLALQLQ